MLSASVSQHTTLYVDGTFKTVSMLNKQFISVHGKKNNYLLKLACGFLVSETQIWYLFMLVDIQEMKG